VSTLIFFCPLPLYLYDYLVSSTTFSIWMWVPSWVIGSAIVVVIKHLIEGKITKVLSMISTTVIAKLRTNPKPGSTYDIHNHTKKQDQS
jgi:hypothetical protein